MFYCVWSNCFRQDMNDKIIQKKTKYFDIRWLNKSKKNKHKDVLDFCARIFWSNFVSLKIKIETLIPTKIIDYYHWDEKNLVLHISNRIIQKSLNFRLSSYNCFFPKNNVWKDWKYILSSILMQRFVSIRAPTGLAYIQSMTLILASDYEFLKI